MHSRRSVLAWGAKALSVAPVAGGFAGQVLKGARREEAATRTVVSIWLNGGEDSNNLIVPLDGRYSAYARGRGELALEASEVYPLHSTRGAAGLHPALGRLGRLFDAGEMSILLGVGDSRRSPDMSGHDYSALEFLTDGEFVPRWAVGVNREAASRRKATLSLEGGVTGFARSAAGKLVEVVGPAGPETRLGRSLAEAARAILGRGEAAGPLVLQVVQGGYDTHWNEMAKQQALYAELAEAVEWFWSVISASGLRDRVMLYTDSEFNRELVPNEKGGAEHGWAGHRLMLGGPLAGGSLHGEFPSLEPGGADDATGRGAWRPKMERAEMERLIANWAGVEA